MANRSKSKKGQATESGKLKPEKDKQVTVKQIVRDERTHKITGAVFLLVAVFLFIAFTSYLFTWKEDQSNVLHGLWSTSDVKVANLLGHLGAWISSKFFYFGFGLASYLFCTLFFVVGANLLYARKIFSTSRNLRYLLTGLLFFSVTLSFVSRGSGFPWGGAVGDMIRDWLTGLLGRLGTAALLFVVGLAYFIWRFNPVFKVPKVPRLPLKDKLQPVVAENDSKEETSVGGARLFVEEGFSNLQGNILKEDGGVVVISPKPEPLMDPILDFKMTEKEDDPEIGEEEEYDEEEIAGMENGMQNGMQHEEGPEFIASPVKTKEKARMPDLELEVRAVEERAGAVEIRQMARVGKGLELAGPPDRSRTMNRPWICAIINTRRWICWKRMAARRSSRMPRNWIPIRTRSSIR